MSNTSKRFEGETRDWNFEKNFGFIDYESDDGQCRTVFYCSRNIQEDWRGSRAWAFCPSIPVTFTISRRLVKDQHKKYAEDVAPIFPMSEPELLAAYRETSEMISKKNDYGFLKRPCGDVLFVHLGDVLEQYKNRWNLLTIGSPVYHGVRYDEGTQKWRADYVELYSLDEQLSFNNESEPELEPMPVAEPVPEPLAPANRSKTFRQLALDKRVHHEFSKKVETKS